MNYRYLATTLMTTLALGTLASAQPRAGIAQPVRFFQPQYNDAKAVVTTLKSPNTAVSLNNGKLVGVPGTVDGKAFVRILRGNDLVASGQAGADGAFVLTPTISVTDTDTVDVRYKAASFTSGFTKTDAALADWQKHAVANATASSSGVQLDLAPYEFGRASNAFQADGTELATHKERFVAGKFGQGVMLEEPTNNMLVNTDFANYTGTTGVADNWKTFVQGVTGTFAFETATVRRGAGAQKITMDAPSPTLEAKTVITQSATQITAGAPHTWSAYVNGSVTGTARGYMVMDYYDSANTFISRSVQYFTPTAAWQRVAMTMIAPANGYKLHAEVGLEARTAGDAGTLYVDDGQVEEKNHETSYVNGVREFEALSFPTSTTAASEGAVSFWWKPMNSAATVMDHVTSVKLLQLGRYYTNGSFSLWAYPVGSEAPALRVFIKGMQASNWSIDGGQVAAYSSNWYDPNAFHHFTVTWKNGNNFRVYIDGALAGGPYTIADPITSWAGNRNHLGTQWVGSGISNAYFDDLRVSSRERKASEIAADYAAGALSYEGDTTLKLSFEGAAREGAVASKTLDISSGSASRATLSWMSTTPANTVVGVDTRVSLDGGNLWSGWTSATSGSQIPGIAPGADLSNARLQYRGKLSSTDGVNAPTLTSVTVSVNP